MQQLISINEESNKVGKKLGFEMDLRGFSKKTKEAYVFQIKKFLEFTNKHPRLITLTDAKRYIVHLKKQDKKHATINLAVCAIRFLYWEIWRKRSFSELKQLKLENRSPLDY